MAKQGGKPKKSTLFKGPVRPVKDEDWEAWIKGPHGNPSKAPKMPRLMK